MKNFQTYFTISGLVTSLILGLAPSFWDSVSDFIFAHEEEKLKSQSLGTLKYTVDGILHSVPASAYLTYFFISLPVHMSAASGLHRTFCMLSSKLCGRNSQDQKCYWLLRAGKGVANLLFVAALVTAAVFLVLLVPRYFYYSAVLSTIIVLGVKILALFVHGPEMKKLSTRATSAESQYESSLQVFLVVWIILKNRDQGNEIPGSSISSILSSLLMISKSGAESYLTFGEENKLEICGRGWGGLLSKLKLLATYSPVFLVTAVFRLSAAVVVFSWDQDFGIWVLLLGVLIAIPSFLLLLLKLCKLKDLSAVDLLEGVVGEMTTHSLWGGRGREGSKRIQLFMAIYFVACYTVCLCLVIWDLGFAGCRDNDISVSFLCQSGTREPVAISCIAFGWHLREVLSNQLLWNLTLKSEKMKLVTF